MTNKIQSTTAVLETTSGPDDTPPAAPALALRVPEPANDNDVTDYPHLVIRLADDEKERLEIALSNEKLPVGPDYTDQLTKLRKLAWLNLNSTTLDMLMRIQAAAVRPGVVLLENLPVDRDLVKTPTSQDPSSSKSTHVSENVLLMFGTFFGEPYGMATEDQCLVNNLIPRRDHLNKLTGLGARRPLKFHTENAALRTLFGDDLAPDWLLLTGLRQEPLTDPFTQTSDVRLSLAELSEQNARTLRMKKYRYRVPYRWDDLVPKERRFTEPMAMIRGPNWAPEVSAVFYDGIVQPMDCDARAAMVELEERVEANSVNHVIKPGMLIAINNRFVLHSRTAFEPHFDEEGNPSRWVQRIFTKYDLSKFGPWQKDSDRVMSP